MDSKLFIGQQNEVVLTFDHMLEIDPDAVFFDESISLFYLFLPGGKGVLEMNCAIHADAVSMIKTQSICHLGFFEDGVMRKASTMPLLHSESVFEKGALQ